MMQTAIKRRKSGIDDLLRNFTPQQPDEEKPVQTSGKTSFADLLKKYETVLGWEIDQDNRYEFIEKIKNYIQGASTIDKILVPDEINQFLQTTITYEEHKGYQELTGIFITRLIQDSYNAGHNNFQLNTQSVQELDFLGAFLEGRRDKKLGISITGNVRSCFGDSANYSTFTIIGDAGWRYGYRSENSTFAITGNVGFQSGDGAKNSTFKTSNKETHHLFSIWVPSRNESGNNKVVYINPDRIAERCCNAFKELKRYWSQSIAYITGLRK